MGTRTSSGFTIIETVLFLAVSGLLVLGALIGTSTAINAQRYRDAVESFKTILQDQYAELGSMKNDRADTWSCGTDAVPVVGSELRGQSNCVVVGKYVTVNRADIAIYTVLARSQSTGVGTTDILSLKNRYTYNVVPNSTEVQTMEWQTQIAWPQSGAESQSDTTPRTLGVLFIRSPETGRVYTFTSNTIPASPSAIRNQTFTDMIVAGEAVPGQAGRTVCVRANGLLAGGDMAIYINPVAANSSAIEVRSNDLNGVAKC